jgi:hypothetical protein
MFSGCSRTVDEAEKKRNGPQMYARPLPTPLTLVFDSQPTVSGLRSCTPTSCTRQTYTLLSIVRLVKRQREGISHDGHHDTDCADLHRSCTSLYKSGSLA